jgi:hypothetical protein
MIGRPFSRFQILPTLLSSPLVVHFLPGNPLLVLN